MTNPSVPRQHSPAALLLPIAALAGLAIAIFNFVSPDNGIHGSAGALLVVISTGLILAASAALLAAALPRWLRGTLLTLLALGIAGTALAAYMLEADLLLGVMVVALIGWILRPGPSMPRSKLQPQVSR